jgi:uncharacterized protein YjbJ (UPF0337 family)
VGGGGTPTPIVKHEVHYFLKRRHMKSSTKDQLEGKVHEVKGTIKEKVGHVTNDPNLEAEGQDEKVAGTVQKKIGQVEKVLEK